MFKQKTVFVVGAGASVEFNFPLGSTLKQEIARLVNVDFDGPFSEPTQGDGVVATALREQAARTDNDLERLVNAGRQIKNGMPGSRSIDNFLHSRDGDTDINLVGKLGIARAILRSERSSPLYISTPREVARRSGQPMSYLDLNDFADGFNPMADSWLGKLCIQLCQEFHRDRLDDLFDNVSFIIFNYDRCVEHYIWNFLQRYFSVTEAVATELVSKAHFHHPYGVVGRLPWQRGGGHSLHFGAEPTANDLLAVVRDIKTFTESVGDEDRDRLKDDLSNAQRIVFLGFGFIDQNMKLLDMTLSAGRVSCPVYITAYGMSEDSRLVIGQSITKAFHFKQGFHPTEPNNIQVHLGMTASALFDHYLLRLGQ